MSRSRRRHDPGTIPSLARRRVLGGVLIAATALLLTLAYLKPDPFASHLTVRAIFREAAGTELVGGEVRMAGTPVGKVVDRQVTGGEALLTLEIEPSAGPISADATAALRPRTPFEGPAFIALDPGTPGGPPLRGALTRTRNYVGLDQALRFARPSTRRALRGVLRAGDAALAGDGSGGLARTLRRAPALTASLAPAARAARGPHGDELAGAVTHLADTVDEVAIRRSALLPLLHGMQRTAAALHTNAGAPLARAIHELALRTAQLDAGGRSLTALVDRLDVIGTELRPALRALPPALADTGTVLREATPVLKQAPPLLRALRGALAAGARSSPPARRLLRALDPTLRLLNGSLLGALAKPTSLGIPAYLQFLTLFQGGAGASRPFQTAAQSQQQGTGPGHFMRFGARFFTGAGYPAPPCTALAAVDPALAAAFAAGGVCTP